MTEQAVNMEISTETCTRDLKKSVNLLHYFFRFRVFYGRFGSYANFDVFVVVLSFRFVDFLCKGDCFDGKNEI